MTASSVKPNGPALAIGGFLSGVAVAGLFMLSHFVDKWKMSGPDTPTDDYFYAHVEHGGLTYFNAMQSTASHLSIPIWVSLMIGILIANAAYGENPFKRRGITRADWPVIAFQFVGIAVAIVVIYFYGHDILKALIQSPFGPSNDDLSMVRKD